jgi:hypothetical protein
MPSSETITVEPASTTARPAVFIASLIACSDVPVSRACR